jgi:hypothetical protein
MRPDPDQFKIRRPNDPRRPGPVPVLSADSRPGHPRNVADAPVRFTDWAMI